MADRYILLKNIPDAPEGTILTYNPVQGTYDYLTVWNESAFYSKRYVENNKCWFKKIEEKLYTEEDMRKAYEGGMTYGMMSYQTRVDPSFNFLKWLENYIRSKSLTSK